MFNGAGGGGGSAIAAKTRRRLCPPEFEHGSAQISSSSVKTKRASGLLASGAAMTCLRGRRARLEERR